MTELVGIIGGAGEEGSHFADIIKNAKKQNLEIAISDIDVEKAKRLCSERGYIHMSSEELVDKSNLVIFSLPIMDIIGKNIERITESEIKRLAGKANEAIADLTSTKTKSVQAMIKYSKPNVEIFSVHGMYRPTVSPLGQNVLFVPERPKEGGPWFNRLMAIFDKNRANTDILRDSHDHDLEMGPLQVKPQAIAYLFLSMLEQLSEKVGLERLQKHSTLLFRLMLDAAGRVVANPNQGKMYGAIQIENPITKEVYALLKKNLDHLENLALSGDLQGFDDLHKRLNKFLGNYAKIAEERTDKIMGHPIGIEVYFEREIGDTIKETLKPFNPDIRRYKEYLDTTKIPDGELTKIRRVFPLAKCVPHGVECYKEGVDVFYLHNKNHPRYKNKKIRFSPAVPPGLEKLDVEKLENVNNLLTAILSGEKKSDHEMSEMIKASYEGVQVIGGFLDSLKRFNTKNQKYERVQMFNRFGDPFLNIFDTWNRIEELSSLGHLVAYRTEK